MYGKSVPQIKVLNMTTKDNTGTLLCIHLYAANSLFVQPLDFTMPREAVAVPAPHRETTETFNKLSRSSVLKLLPLISIDSHQFFMIACLKENASVSMKQGKKQFSFKILSRKMHI